MFFYTNYPNRNVGKEKDLSHKSTHEQMLLNLYVQFSIRFEITRFPLQLMAWRNVLVSFSHKKITEKIRSHQLYINVSIIISSFSFHFLTKSIHLNQANPFGRCRLINKLRSQRVNSMLTVLLMLYLMALFLFNQFCYWIELNWIELNWIELNWIELTYWIELNWIELNWIELNWNELNWIELNWIDLLNSKQSITSRRTQRSQ